MFRRRLREVPIRIAGLEQKFFKSVPIYNRMNPRIQTIAIAPCTKAGRAWDTSPAKNPTVSIPALKVNSKEPTSVTCLMSPPLFKPDNWPSIPWSDSTCACFRSSMAVSTFLVSSLTLESIFFMFSSAAASLCSSSSIRACVLSAFRSALSRAIDICSVRISSNPSNSWAFALSKIFSISDIISSLSRNDSLSNATDSLSATCSRASTRASSIALSISLFVISA
mmetsp:Transcript_4637/g.11796  ORF Transcript_4637/g.11796 Transcript_4637/m.11796 type:complete len:224 (+) Transcript_4637:1728-2399(+)